MSVWRKDVETCLGMVHYISHCGLGHRTCVGVNQMILKTNKQFASAQDYQNDADGWELTKCSPSASSSLSFLLAPFPPLLFFHFQISLIRFWHLSRSSNHVNQIFCKSLNFSFLIQVVLSMVCVLQEAYRSFPLSMSAKIILRQSVSRFLPSILLS